MKKILSWSLLGICLVVTSHADIIYPDGSKPAVEPFAIKKISRGIANTALFALEIPRTVFEVGQESGITSTDQFTLGFTRGGYRSMLRLSSGLYDVGTGFNDLGVFVADQLAVQNHEGIFWKHAKTGDSLIHLTPETLSITDAIPGYNQQFDWETIETVAPNQNVR